MGYHVQIIRKKNGSIDPIKPSEIEELVKTTPNSRIASSNLKSADFDLIVSENQQEICWLTLQRGELWANNPNEVQISAMIKIANQLGARVRGDEYETYRSPTESYFDADDADEIKKNKQKDEIILQPLIREQRLIKIAIISFFCLIGLVAFLVGKYFES